MALNNPAKVGLPNHARGKKYINRLDKDTIFFRAKKWREGEDEVMEFLCSSTVANQTLPL